MIDSHCHLEMLKIPPENALKNFKLAGGKALLSICTDGPSIEFLKHGFSHEEDINVYISSGIHPHEAKHWNQDLKQKIHLLSQTPQCIAIGEVGFDFHYNNSSPQKQKTCFEEQIQMALDSQLPLIIHTRDAEKEILEVLDHFHCEKVLIHCFTGTYEFAKKCWSRNYLTSFSGIVSFKNALEIHKVAQECPLNLMLIETDSPYLTPVPFRGKPNEPAYVRYVAEAIANLKNLSSEQIITSTSENFYHFFTKAKKKGDGC